MKIPAHAKYQIIYDTMQKNNNLLNVTADSDEYQKNPVADEEVQLTVPYPQGKSLSENGKSNVMQW